MGVGREHFCSGSEREDAGFQVLSEPFRDSLLLGPNSGVRSELLGLFLFEPLW